MSRVIADNDPELALVGTMLDGAAVGGLSESAKTGLAEVATLLDRRRAEGSVRRCHGDLRLANICLYDSRPTLFDCIEFSDEIGCINVLYDLAFLLVDLHTRGRLDLSNAVFTAYLEDAREADGLRVRRYFCPYGPRREATRWPAECDALGTHLRPSI
jgi:aminoglycoside phosphotransferase family enzyme